MSAAQSMIRTGRRGVTHELWMATADFTSSLKRIKLAWALASHDVVARYRGSLIGPLWITISMGIMVLGIGTLYSQLFKIDTSVFLPYVAIGLVTWGLISGVIIEGCDTFVQAGGMLRQTALPMFTFTWRILLRNLINLAHHGVIVVAVLAWSGGWRSASPWWALLGLALVVLNLGWLSMFAGIVSARFRDVPQIVVAVMQFAMFLTPVFWQASQVPERHAVLAFNPFYYMLDSVRSPLLGAPIDPLTVPVLVMIIVVGWSLTITLFTLTRRRIVHYL